VSKPNALIPTGLETFKAEFQSNLGEGAEMSDSGLALKSKETPPGERENAVPQDSRTDARLAYAFLRIVLGVNILFHGASRFLGQHDAFLNYLEQKMAHAPLVSTAFLPLFAAVLPWVEAGIGLLLTLGLLTRIAILAGSMVMIVLMAGVCLAQDWNTAGLQLIYCLIYFILLSYRERNFYSLDGWLGKSS
jgi:thiosulfate dehydrogenase [quinone] large subunit